MKNINPLRSQFRVDMEKLKLSEKSSSEEKISKNMTVSIKPQSNITSKKIMQAYKKGQLNAVGEIMKERWTVRRHSAL